MLIPSICISDFKKLAASQIREMKSVEVQSDNETLFIAIIPPLGQGMTITDYIKTQGEYLGVRGNTVGGKEPQELLGKNATVSV